MGSIGAAFALAVELCGPDIVQDFACAVGGFALAEGRDFRNEVRVRSDGLLNSCAAAIPTFMLVAEPSRRRWSLVQRL